MDLPDDCLFVDFQATHDNILTAEVHRRFEPWMLKAARYRCKRLGLPETEDEDIVADAFLKILATKTLFDPRRGRVRGYINGHIKNAAKAAYRGRRGRIMDVEVSIKRAKDPNNDILRYENQEFVRETVLKKWPRKTVEMVESYYIRNETQEEIAARFGVAHTTVGRRLASFHMQARKRIDEFGLAV